MGMIALAMLWGFAEATLFFIVPDVLLSIIALRSGVRTAMKAAMAAGLGAVLGGAVMYQWARHDPEAARATLSLVPGISDAMISAVDQDFAARGWATMFAGAFLGIPYKLYAAAAGSSGAGFPSLLLLTIPARLPRFLLTCVIAAPAGRWISAGLSRRAAFIALALFWVVFYAAYFAAHRG